MSNFAEIDIQKILLGGPNVRKIDVDLGINELAKSIEEQGLLQPIIVRKINSEYECIAGQRRLTAMNKLGKKTVPSMIVDTSDPNTLMLISLIENVQRVDIDDRDRSQATERLVDVNNGDYALVAKMLGKSEATIRIWSGYHGVPEEIKEMKDQGLFDRQEAIRLTSMLGTKKAVEVAKEIASFPKNQRKKVFHGLKRYTALQPEEVISWATRPPQEKALSIRFMSSILVGLERASAARGETPEQTVEYIVLEWLQKRNYLESGEQE